VPGRHQTIGRFLTSSTPAEELASFLSARGHSLLDSGRASEPQAGYAKTAELVPDDPALAAWQRQAEARQHGRSAAASLPPRVRPPRSPRPIDPLAELRRIERLNAETRRQLNETLGMPTPPAPPNPYGPQLSSLPIPQPGLPQPQHQGVDFFRLAVSALARLLGLLGLTIEPNSQAPARRSGMWPVSLGKPKPRPMAVVDYSVKPWVVRDVMNVEHRLQEWIADLLQQSLPQAVCVGKHVPGGCGSRKPNAFFEFAFNLPPRPSDVAYKDSARVCPLFQKSGHIAVFGREEQLGKQFDVAEESVLVQRH